MRYNKTNRDWRYRSLLEIVSPQLGKYCPRQILSLASPQAIFPKLWGNNFGTWAIFPQLREINLTIDLDASHYLYNSDLNASHYLYNSDLNASHYL